MKVVLLPQALLLLQYAHLASTAAGPSTQTGALEYLHDAPLDTAFVLSLILTRHNLEHLEPLLKAVSTPGSPQYGQYLDRDEVNTLFPIANATPVLEWLHRSEINVTCLEGGVLELHTEVAKANALFQTTFAYYRSGSSETLSMDHYTVPAHLESSIDLVTTTVVQAKSRLAKRESSPSRLVRRAAGSRTASSIPCESSITPSCLREMYNIGNYTPQVGTGSRIGFTSFLNQSALYADIARYEKFFGLPAENITTELIQRADNDQNGTTASYIEANLDAELIVALSGPLPTVEFITGGSPPFTPNLDEPTINRNEPYLAYYENLMLRSNAELPQVISNSYGDDEQTVPIAYAKRVCNMIGLMGLRGISILQSSGDTGIGSPCQSNDGSRTPEFTPIFPATCPYITAIGGTQGFEPEIAWNASSGGFSNYFPRAWYQDTAVGTYLDQYLSDETHEYYARYTNFSGRGFPDVSAHSMYPDYKVIYDGYFYGSGGTSASCPVFAAIVALLNDARLAAGRPALGFLNPLMYALRSSAAWRDIEVGQANGCNGVNPQTNRRVPGASVIPWAHWNATTGWDPVTGLGTPDFAQLKALVLAL
ncbi:S53 family peptidase [Aspergillus brunneoviolaceus CBS 621.78]|uniref:Tripeptidyl-peptidase sed4 n=1 Tax=Aspergillus brunneoviolaceus CBS 621.78 TaxID=1450534 RepID=A0ACD1GJ63_9EURO|nr:Tripeptidyl-peptidase sed4 [Aspergillus brunneoviolaceus CBS 621.78]RAH49188.1 Tripeptidyl-peptidase sed4 [Aspergillus brunneoviolaceus CBS 621.78]